MLVVAVKLISVAAVLGVGLLLLARRANGGGIGRGAGVRVEARHGLSKSAVVAVVTVDGRRFLVGAGDGSVSLLTELDEAAEVATDAVEARTRDSHGSGVIPTSITGPWIGLLDRCRAMTVRSHAERQIHAPDHVG